MVRKYFCRYSVIYNCFLADLEINAFAFGAISDVEYRLKSLKAQQTDSLNSF